MLILFEGIDGSGKTTLAKHFAADARSQKRTVEEFAFPSKGPIGKLVRAAFAGELDINPLAYQHLLVADALDYEDDVQSSLKHFDFTVMDRHPTVSGMVYQTETYSLDTVLHVNSWPLFTMPDLVVLVDVPVAVAMERMRARIATDEYERADASLWTQRRAKYMGALALMPCSTVILDGQDAPGVNVSKVMEMFTYEKPKN